MQATRKKNIIKNRNQEIKKMKTIKEINGIKFWDVSGQQIN
jgi:hypothetical protein